MCRTQWSNYCQYDIAVNYIIDNLFFLKLSIIQSMSEDIIPPVRFPNFTVPNFFMYWKKFRDSRMFAEIGDLTSIKLSY